MIDSCQFGLMGEPAGPGFKAKGPAMDLRKLIYFTQVVESGSFLKRQTRCMWRNRL